MEGSLNSISKSYKGDNIDFGMRDEIFWDGHEGSNVVPVLVDEEESCFISDMSNIAELGIGQIVPILIPDVLVNFNWAVFRIKDGASLALEGVADKCTSNC